MSQEGGPLYNSWANEVLPATRHPDPWDDYVRLTEKVNPGIVEGVVLDPHDVVRTLLRKDGGLLPGADIQTRASERLLIPRKEEILHYTSAATFMEEGVSEDEAVATHAQDSLRFAVAIGVGLVDDVFTVRTQKARILLNRLMVENVTNDSADPAPALQAVQETLGPLWDSSLEQPGMEHNPDILERFFALQRLAFIAKSLDNHTLQTHLEEVSVTAFDQLGNQSITLRSQLLKADENDAARFSVDGWQYRAHHFGLLASSHPSRPKSVLIHDLESDTFSVPTKVIKHLHDALRRQNQEGLHQSSLKTAGNVQNLELPLSIGCPVHNMGSIPAAARLGAEVFERMITYHQKHPRRAT